MMTNEWAHALAAPLLAGRHQRAQRDYVARAIAELLHERLIQADVRPLDEGPAKLSLATDRPGVTWECRASRRSLDFWHVLPETVERLEDGRPTAWSATRFFVDLRETIGIEPFTLAKFIEETAQTLYADACIRLRGRPSVTTLARAGHQEIERAMEGHPWILVNKGRMGFGAEEQRTLTPESGETLRLLWLAARSDVAECHTVQGLTYDELLAREFGDELTALRARIAEAGHDPAGYVLLPVHPWQFAHKLVIQLADELADGRLLVLGVSRDPYRPQQSIRTFQNAERPDRAYVKTSLSILNTGQIRGLSPQKLRVAPLVTEWLRERFAGDEELARCGFSFLGEIATVSVPNVELAGVAGVPYQYRELLGALFRESAAASLGDGETLATMASLLYVDDDGRALVEALADRAGVSLASWLARYLAAYFRPLLHCFFRHETFFVAHGENTLLVLERGLPKRVILKDLVEEVQVSRRERQRLPEAVRELLYDVDDALVPLYVLTDVFDGFFRYLADVLVTHCAFPEEDFWRLVQEAVRGYQADHPELAETFARYDLFVPEFPRFCINKYRLVLFGYADVADNVLDTDPKFSGTLPNPIGRLAPSPAIATSESSAEERA